MPYKLDLLMIPFLVISAGNILAGLGSFCIIIYYLSMLKINVIDKKHEGRWWLFFRSWFVRKIK